MVNVLTIKAFFVGGAKPIATKMAVIPNPDEITLRALIDKKIRQTAPSLAFSISDIHHITQVVAMDHDQTDVLDFLDFPVSVLLEQLETKRPGIAVSFGLAEPSLSYQSVNPQVLEEDRKLSNYNVQSQRESTVSFVSHQHKTPSEILADDDCDFAKPEGVSEYGVRYNSGEDRGLFEEVNDLSKNKDDGDGSLGIRSLSMDNNDGSGSGGLSSPLSTDDCNEFGNELTTLEYDQNELSNTSGDESVGAISNATPMDVLQTIVANAIATQNTMNPQEPMRFDPSSPIPLLPAWLCGTNVMDSISVMTPNSATICEPEVPMKDYEHYQESSAPDIATIRSIANDCINAGNDGGAIDIITSILIENNSLSLSVDVPLFCLTTLWVLARRSDDNKRKIIFEGGTLDGIIEVMRIYCDMNMPVEIQIKACGLLWALSMKPNDRVHVVQSGGCIAILKAMVQYINDESLQTIALGALKVLSSSSKIKYEIDMRKALSIVSSVMQRNAYNATVQCKGCVVMSNLVTTDDNQFVVAVSEKEISAIVNGILANPEAHDVHETACFVASSSANVDLIRNISTSRVALELAFEKSPEKLLRLLNFDDINASTIEGTMGNRSGNAWS